MAPSLKSAALVAMLMLVVLAASSQAAEARKMTCENRTPNKCTVKRYENNLPSVLSQSGLIGLSTRYSITSSSSE